jgi:hypothetical protein
VLWKYAANFDPMKDPRMQLALLLFSGHMSGICIECDVELVRGVTLFEVLCECLRTHHLQFEAVRTYRRLVSCITLSCVTGISEYETNARVAE